MSLNLAAIQSALPSITDWEDSYLQDKRQRLLGNTDTYKAEIILGDEIYSVCIIFNSVTPEILNAVGLFSGSIENSLQFLKDAATFVASNPNTNYMRDFGGYSAKMIRIQAPDDSTQVLTFQRVQD